MATPPDFSVGQVLTAAHMNAVGLWLIDEFTASAAGTLECDAIFTADFTHYKLLITGYTNNAGELQYRFNDGGTPNTSAQYWRRGFYYSAGVTSVDSSGTTEHFLMYTSGSSGAPNTAELEVYSPQESVRTSVQLRAYDHHNARQIMYGGGFVNTNSFTGIDIFAAGAATNWTGKVRVYGYRDE